MGNLTVKGLDSFVDFTNEIASQTDAIIKASMYEGVKILADEAKKAVEGLRTESGGQTPRYITKIQKDGLKEGLGVARFRKEDGKWTTVIGFNGYNRLRTRKYPNGQPNQLVARSVESGTSYQKKEPFMRKAYNNARAKAIAAVQAQAIKEIERRK